MQILCPYYSESPFDIMTKFQSEIMHCIADSASNFQVVSTTISNYVLFQLVGTPYAILLPSTTIPMIYFEQPNVIASTIETAWYTAR